MAKKSRDLDFVPANYEELYKHYVAGEGSNSIVRTLVRTFLTHGTEEELETLTQDVFLRCIDKKVIEGYDREKANFGGVIYFVTRSICCNHLDRKQRDPISGLYGGSLTTEESSEEGFTPGVYQLDRFYVPTPDIARSYEAHEQVQSLLSHTQALANAPKNKRDESLFALVS